MKYRKRIFTLCTLMIIALALLAGCHSVESDEQGPLNNLNNFTAYNMSGETFTQAEFAEHDLNIVFFWAPWSEASVYELKQMAAFSEELPDNVSFISVCLDSELKESKEKLKNLKLRGFTTLKEGDGDFKAMSTAIVNVPTTVIVDNAGNLVGEPVIGIQEDFEKEYVSLLNNAMNKIGGEKIVLNENNEDAEEEVSTEASTKETEKTAKDKDKDAEKDEDTKE